MRDNHVYQTIDLDSTNQLEPIVSAANVAKWFKPRQQLPVAAHLMAVGNKNDAQLISIAQQLQKAYPRPSDWQQNQSLLYHFLELDGIKEVQQAVEMMRKFMVLSDQQCFFHGPILIGLTKLRLEQEE